MLPYNAKKSAMIRQLNAAAGPVGPGMLQSGMSHSIMEQDNYGTPYPMLGVVTNTGPYGEEPDYTDSRYWVQLQNNYLTPNAKTGSDVAMNLQNSSSGTDFRGTTVQAIIVASNPSEVADQTHSLTVGTQVQLLPVY